MKRFALSFLALVMALSSFAFAAEPGSSRDPLISRSYMSEYAEQVMEKAGELIDSALNALKKSVNDSLAGMGVPTASEQGWTIVTVEKDYALAIEERTGAVLLSGSASFEETAGDVLNLSKGGSAAEGDRAAASSRYMTAEGSGALLRVTSAEAVFAVDGSYTTRYLGRQIIPVEFSDIETHWARSDIEYLASLGAVNGMGGGVFEPEGTVTRAMFVTVMGRVLEVDKDKYANAAFSDVDPAEWYGPYVAWAAENGIVNGMGDGTFDPESNITREQMAAVIMRLSGYMGASLKNVTAKINFEDEAEMSAWAVDDIYRAQTTGLIKGRTDTSFDPQGTATRAEICVIVRRYLKALE